MTLKQIYRDLSIKNKLLLMILTSLLSLTAMIFIFLVQYKYNEEIDVITASTEIHAKLISEYTSTALLFQDISSAEKILDKLIHIRYIQQATLFDTNKIEFSSYISKGNREILNLNIISPKDTTFLDNDFIHVVKKIKYGDKNYGYIYVVASAKSFYPVIYDYAFIILIILLSTIFLTSIIAYLLQRSISSPILQLTDYVTSMLSDPYKKIEFTVKSNDEIGKLGASFISMHANLNQKEIERQKAFDSLIESSLRFQAITENIKDYIAIIDNQGLFKYCNPTFENLGYSIDELLGYNFINILHFDEIAKFKKMLIEINTNNESKSFEFRINAGNNKHLLVEGVMLPMFELPGVNGVLTTFRDITERKNSEIAIRESENKLRTIINQAADAIYMIDKESNFKDVNYYATKMTGFSIEEFMQMKVADIEAFLTPVEITEIINTLKIGEHYSFESYHKRKDGTAFPVDIKVGKVKINDNILVLSYVRDISERKNHEIEMKKKSDEIDRYFNSSLDLLCIATIEGYFYRLNPEWENVLGYKLKELENKRFIDFIHPDDLEATLEATKNLATSKTILNFTNRYKCKDGTYKWIEWRSIPLENMIYAAARDITKRKIDELDKERLTKELVEKNKELEQIIYVTSHDLRSPLVNVQGFSSELANSLKLVSEKIHKLKISEKEINEIKSMLDEDIPHFLSFITTSVTKMEGLLKALLRVSRLGRGELNLTLLNMNSLIEKVIISHKYSIDRNNLKISHTSLPDCYGDEIQINQLFSNLIDNAVKYSKPNVTNNISISGKQEKDKVIFIVEDTGIGIKKEHLNIIFDMFHRLDPSSTKGEGIGLNIIKKILERHNGSMRVESEINVGSKFFIELPVLDNIGGKNVTGS